MTRQGSIGLLRFLCRAAGWMLLSAGVTIALVWFASGWAWISCNTPQGRAMASQGVLFLEEPGTGGIIPGGEYDGAWLPGRVPSWKWWRYDTSSRIGALAAPAGGLLLLGLLLIWAAKVRYRRGCCRACGYDLAGLPNLRCPECAHDNAPKRRRQANGAA